MHEADKGYPTEWMGYGNKMEWPKRFNPDHAGEQHVLTEARASNRDKNAYHVRFVPFLPSWLSFGRNQYRVKLRTSRAMTASLGRGNWSPTNTEKRQPRLT